MTHSSQLGDQMINMRMVAPAHRNLLSIGEQHGEVARGFPSYFLHIAQIDNRGAMDAHKHSRIELALNTSHRFPQQMAFRSGADANIILFGRDPSNLRQRQEKNAAARFEHDAGWSQVSVRGLLSLPGAAGRAVLNP